MRIFLGLLGVIVSAVGLAVLVRTNTGNVVFFWPPYRIDLSLNLFLFLLLLLGGLLFLIFKAVRLARARPLRMSVLKRLEQEKKSHQALREALKALFEGRFVEAEKASRRAMISVPHKACAHLIAARAFHALQRYDSRDASLTTAEADPAYRMASRITRIECLMDQQKAEEALEIIGCLNARGARHVHVLRLALMAHRLAGHWEEVARLAGVLNHHHAIRPDAFEEMKEEICKNKIIEAGSDAERVREVWQALTPEERQVPSVAFYAAYAFFFGGWLEETRKALTQALKKNWDDRLMRAYAEFSSTTAPDDLAKRIQHCENWKEKYAHQPQWTLTLGELYWRSGQFERARHYLEKTIDHKPEKALVLRAGYLLTLLDNTKAEAEDRIICR